MSFTSWTRRDSELVLVSHSPLTIRSFFAQVERICSKGYVPSESDVLRARAKTTGITETRFNMGQLSIQYVYR